jgi:hypothetical protein
MKHRTKAPASAGSRIQRKAIPNRRSKVTQQKRSESLEQSESSLQLKQSKQSKRSNRSKMSKQPGKLLPYKREPILQSEKAWRKWGEQAGREDADLYSLADADYQKKALNGHWLKRMKEKRLTGKSWPHYWQAAKGYLDGYGRVSGIATYDWMLLPTGSTVAAVISVMNEEATVMKVLQELHRLPLDEIIVVVNGSRDSTFQRVREGSNALIVYYPEPLGYDVGRVIGSRLTNSDIIIYLDGDVPMVAEELLPFIGAIDQGADVALNHISPYLKVFSQWDGVSMVKQFINRAMGRPDLGADSLTAIPHALSRKALDTIGSEHLMVPPQAHVLAIAKGLVVSAPWSIDVITTNRVNEHNAGELNSVSELIIGDHIEALHTAQELGGERLSFPDVIRRRTYLA